MPIYEYYCVDCHETFELMRSLAEADAEATCEKCGGTQTRRVVSSFAAFSSEGGSRRAVAGSSPCSGCGAVGTGCASCDVKR